ncbi:GTP cyclohydrolase II-domain-containing protein [Aspergillus cavernicola]|uniref:GTP cyclohydrolase II n=1 Tax=Aspergillus cavernicola TaxID=176166 RepID=A0ABR4I0H3_9EURO
MANLPSHASPTFGPQPTSTTQPVDENPLTSGKSVSSPDSQLDGFTQGNPAGEASGFGSTPGDMTPVPASLLSPSFTPPATPGGTLNTERLLQQVLPQSVSHLKPPKLLPRLPDVECIVRARIPTTNGAEMFLHLYRNDLDNKEHLAIVFGNTIRSRSLDKVRPGETEMDRMIRGAYAGKLHPGRVSSWYDEALQEERSPSGSSKDTDGGAVRDPELMQGQLSQAPLVRIHSECYTGETAWSARCDCGEQLDEAARLMSLPMETLNEIASQQSWSVPSNVSGGVIIYLRQEGRGIGLGEKLKAYNLQDLGSDTVEANLLLRHPADARSYGLATAMLADLGLGVDTNPHGIRLLTNNPDKVRAIEGPAREVIVKERVPMVPLSWQSGGKMGIKSSEIEGYLRTKISKMGHMIQ